jgi:hypothetical protein
MFKSLLLFSLAIPVVASAATFYVDNSCANNGNGRAAACAASNGAIGAWNSTDAASACSGMVAGDHLQFRNIGKVHAFTGGGYAMTTIQSGCSGTAANPMIVENYPGETAVFDGTSDVHGGNWTSIGNGVYSKAISSYRFPFMAWYVPGTGGKEREIYLIQSVRSCDTSLLAGYMRYTASNAVCVHLPDGSNPSAAQSLKIPAVPVAFQTAPGVGHVHFQSNPSGGGFAIQRFIEYGVLTNPDNLDVTVNGLDVGFMMDRCLNFETVGTAAARGLQVLNSHIHHCGQEGMHSGVSNDSAYRVDNNEFDHIQTVPYFESCGANCQPGFTDGGTAIRLSQIPVGHVGGNNFHDLGGARIHSAWSMLNIEGTASSVVVENNYFHDGSQKGTGILGVSGILISSGPPNQCLNCTFRNNRFYNMDQAIAWQADSHDLNSIGIYNNTFVNSYDFAIGSQYGLIGGTGTIRTTNNIFFNVSPPLEGFLNTSGQPAFAAPTYNDFFCTNNCSSMALTSAGNHYSDPNIDLSGASPTLKILGPGGALDQGTALSPSFPDFVGTSRPQGIAWDIGAHEFVGGVQPPPYSLLTTQVPAFIGTDNTPYELGMKWKSSVAGQVSAIRFYKGASEAGTHTGHLWNASGALLATVVFTGESASGWQSAKLSTPVAITPNSTYVVSVSTSNNYFADTRDVFAAVVTNQSLFSIADGLNGVFGGIGTFPTNSYHNSNYFRDVVFAPMP